MVRAGKSRKSNDSVNVLIWTWLKEPNFKCVILRQLLSFLYNVVQNLIKKNVPSFVQLEW